MRNIRVIAALVGQCHIKAGMTMRMNRKGSSENCQGKGSTKKVRLPPITVAAKVWWNRLTCQQRQWIRERRQERPNPLPPKFVQNERPLKTKMYEPNGCHRIWYITVSLNSFGVLLVKELQTFYDRRFPDFVLYTVYLNLGIMPTKNIYAQKAGTYRNWITKYAILQKQAVPNIRLTNMSKFCNEWPYRIHETPLQPEINKKRKSWKFSNCFAPMQKVRKIFKDQNPPFQHLLGIMYFLL